MQDQAGKTFDVIVVGSGASGGWAAKRMTEAGLQVALLDAGRDISPSTFTEHQAGFSLPYRDRAPEVVRRTRPNCSQASCMRAFRPNGCAVNMAKVGSLPT